MRWTDFLATLPPEQGAQLVNGLTVGYGSLALAARRAAADASLTTVERAVAAAHDALVRTLMLVPAVLLPLAVQEDRTLRVPLVPALPELNWRAFLTVRGWEETQAVHGLLTGAVSRARQSGTTIMADGEAEAVIADVVATRAALACLHERFLRAAPL